MIPLEISQIRNLKDVLKVNFNKKVYIKSICIDSRKIKKGDLFVCIRGNTFDGHKFIKEALSKGAIGCVVDKRFFDKNFSILDFNFIVVRDTVNFLNEVASFIRSRLKATVIGITGSCGKTTTKDMLSSVLGRNYNVVCSPYSFNNFIGLPLTICEANLSTRYLIAECATNHPGEIGRLASVLRPHLSIITNIGESHLKFFKNKENVFKEKKAIISYTKRALLINGDDPFLRKIRIYKVPKITFGFSSSNDIFVEYLKRKGFSLIFKVNVEREKFKIRTPFYHHIYNCLAAISVGKYLNINNDLIKQGLEEFKFNNMRTQLIRKRGIIFINDAYNSNPLSLEQALKSLYALKARRKIIVLSDMLEQGANSIPSHKRIGRIVHLLGFDYLLCWGKYSYYIFNEFVKLNRYKKAFYFKDKFKLIKKLRRMLRKGDVVFLKGSRATYMEEILAHFN